MPIGALKTTNALTERQLDQGSDQNTFKGEPINMNVTTIAQAAESAQSLVVVSCEHPGCDQYKTGHEVASIDRDAFMHVHAGPWEECPGQVDLYYDTELGRWHAGAAIDDIERARTAEEIHAFAAAWDQAYATAQELNALEAPC